MKEKLEQDNEVEKGKKGRRFPFKEIGLILLLMLVVTLIIYLALNGQSLFKKAQYYYDTLILNKEYQKSADDPVVISNLPSPYSTDNQMPETKQDQTVDQPNQTVNNNEVSLANNQLYIPQINVRAPILWNIHPDNAMNKLREGVVHIKPTALPGQAGNTFITGHSSYYPWDPGKYKHVFALLPQLQEGQLIYIRHQDTLYKYRVFKKMVVKPNETWVTNPVENKTVVSLMTCVPIGTSLKRQIIQAEQIAPKAIAQKEKKEKGSQEEGVSNELMPKIFY